jgi:antibiotic biosynthesis monooxygenase (ABM) superfamily enzyme
MFVRCAFFQGHVKPGLQDAFDAHIEAHLHALWTRFPHVQEARLLREVESDRPETHFALIIMLRFPSREAIAEALDSDIRYASREASKPLFDMFDGHVFHTVFAAEALPLPAGEVILRPAGMGQ